MGFIYVMSNESMPGLLKIGFTEVGLNQRLKQGNASSFIPTPFIIEINKQVSNPREKERIIHKILDSKRNKSNREFFRITLEEIKPIFDLIDCDNLYSEDDLKEIKLTHQKHVRQIWESMKRGERKIYEMYTKVKEELDELRFNVYRNNKIQDFIDNNFISSTNIMNYDILIEHFKEWYSNKFDSDDSPPYKIFLDRLSRKYGKQNENGFYTDIKI